MCYNCIVQRFSLDDSCDVNIFFVTGCLGSQNIETEQIDHLVL